MWIIKAIYPLGGHIVTLEGKPNRFADKQEAAALVEVMNSKRPPGSPTSYIVVEESV